MIRVALLALQGVVPLTSVADFLSGTATLVMPSANGESLQLTYRPHLLNPKFIQKVTRYGEAGDDNGGARLFCELVESWSLLGPLTAWVPTLDDDGEPQYDDDGEEIGAFVEVVSAGQPVPLKPDVLSSIPGPIMSAIFESIMEDASGPKSTKRREKRTRR